MRPIAAWQSQWTLSGAPRRMRTRMSHALALFGLWMAACLTAGPAAPAPSASWPAPPLRAGAWINSPPLRLEALKGKVVVLEFWTFG
jgi:hypothetical protein